MNMFQNNFLIFFSEREDFKHKMNNLLKEIKKVLTERAEAWQTQYTFYKLRKIFL